MEFELTTSSNFYDEEAKTKLEGLGFVFQKDGTFVGIDFYKKDTDLKIEISSLEELMAFIDKWGKLIVSKEEIEIYDGWRE